MPRVFRSTKVQRKQFRKLPRGSVYFLASDGTGPFVKASRTTRLATNTFPITSAGTTVADLSVTTLKVGKNFLGQRSV